MFKLTKRLYEMAGKKKPQILLTIFLQIVDSFFIYFPLAVILYFVYNYLNDSLTINTPFIALAMMVAGVILRGLSKYAVDKLQYEVVYKVFYEERVKVANHIKKINMGYFSDDNIGKITNTVINGMTYIEDHGVMGLTVALSNMANLIVIFTFLCILDIKIALIFAVLVVIVCLVLIPYNKKAKPFVVEDSNTNDELTSSVIDYVRNIETIKAYNLVGKHKKTNEVYLKRKKVDLMGENITIPFVAGIMCIISLGVGAIVYSVLLDKDVIVLYNLVVLVIFSLYIFTNLERLVFKISQFNISNECMEKLQEIYRQNTINDDGTEIPRTHSIEFQNVKFAYDEKAEKNVLDDISFKLEENTLNALVGLSGSGKSTLVNLLSRFFDINEGSIKIGDVDVRNMSQETLYLQIAMVFQNVYLFQDTIYNNIIFGDENATYEDVVVACKKARCYDFIMELPEGFETVVGEGGLSFSGGERQRISIARAILKDAPIILLDEATASIDPDNELEIQEAINALVENKTILTIAHKLSCVKNADKILVLNNGKLEESGKHEELLENGGLYASLWEKRVNSKSWTISN